MKNIKKWSLAFLMLVLISCEEEEVEPTCDFGSLYTEISDVQFEVDGTAYTQNVSKSTFPEAQITPDIAKIYKIANETGGYIPAELFFTYTELLPPDENDYCAANYLHRFYIQLYLEQNPSETKVYPVTNSGKLEDAASSYQFRKEMVLFPNEGSTVTISKFVPQNRLEGTFSFQYPNGKSASGVFNLDLTKRY